MNTLTRSAPSFPRAPLWGAACLVCLALVAATVGRLTGMGAAQPLSTQVSQRSLRFEDGVGGSVLVYDAAATQIPGTGKPIAVAIGQNGFLRGVLRGFARTRRADGVGDEAPFLLTAWEDGRLTLLDPATGRRADLEAFGPTNEAVFARFLKPPQRLAMSSTPSRRAAP